jgi:hypothetical protein
MNCPLCERVFVFEAPVDLCIQAARHFVTEHGDLCLTPAPHSRSPDQTCICGEHASATYGTHDHVGLAMHLLYSGVGDTVSLTQHALETRWRRTAPGASS